LEQEMSQNTALSFRKIAFTGTFQRPRADIEREATLAGAQVHNAVKATTDWLVVAKRPGKVKQKKAKQFGVLVMSEKEYYAYLGDANARAGGNDDIDDANALGRENEIGRQDWMDEIHGRPGVGF
jgi:BRCT domain type II-containing protein